jgi:hypothetical protein
MVWVLVAVTAVLAALVLVLVTLVLRLTRRIDRLEAASASRRARRSESGAEESRRPHLDEGEAAPPEFVITRIGEVEAEPAPEPVPTVPAPIFADLLLKETVVQTASLFQGLRRALDPETRNRIRFHMRQEVKRSRKQRRAELREVRREWAARQRAAAPGGPAHEGTAA